VNYRVVLRVLGMILACEALFMLPSLAVSVYFGGDDIAAFALSILITAVIGIPLTYIKQTSMVCMPVTVLPLLH